MTKELFIFDLDGVITHTSQFHAEAWSTLANQLGLTFNEELVEATKGISRRKSLETILTYHGVQNQYKEAEIERLLTIKNDRYVKLLQNINETDYLPGIKELLATIKKNHHPIAIASASENAPFILSRLKAERYIDVIIDPRPLKGKPAPDIFLAAAQHFQISPQYCIGIEDAQSGIEAIKAANMFAVGVGKKLKGADLLVSSTSELTYDKIMSIYQQD